MTKGPCAMRGLLHGPLVSNRSAWPAGNPREVLRVGPTEVLLDGRRAPGTPWPPQVQLTRKAGRTRQDI
jgi:hypothetical protein